MIAYHARWVLPITRPPIANGTVIVDGSRIAYVGPRTDAPLGDATQHDLGDAALLPGLVNAHTHLELTAMRGLLEGLPFVEWIRTLTRARAAVLDETSMYDSARLGIAEGLRVGITTYADTCSSGVVLSALRDMQVRGIMYQEVFGPDPARHDEALDGLKATIERLRPIETSLVRLGVSPHAVYTVHERLLVDVAAYAMAEHLPIAMHLAESDAEIAFLREADGPFADGLRARGIPVVRRSHSPVHLLVELAVTLSRPLLIHCVKVDETDIAFIAEWQCPVAHCPASNAKLGHGIAPLTDFLNAGVTVGLGSDSTASNNAMHLLGEARLAVLQQNARTAQPDAISVSTALELATLGGARALGLEDRIGSLDVGKEADLAAFGLDDLAEGAGGPESALIFTLGASAVPARLVTVAGVERVRDGDILGLDATLVERVRQTASRLAAWRDSGPAR